MTIEQVCKLVGQDDKPTKPHQWHQHPNGGGWVFEDATVDATAYVGPGVVVCGASKVLNDAWVADSAKIINSTVKDRVKVHGDARICFSVVAGEAEVYGSAVVADDSVVEGQARIYGTAEVYDSTVSGKAVVRDAKVYAESNIRGDVRILGDVKLIGQDLSA